MPSLTCASKLRDVTQSDVTDTAGDVTDTAGDVTDTAGDVT